MPLNDDISKLSGAFFHSIGKVNTRSGNYAGNEKYKSSHNVRSNEVWMDSLPHALTFASASSYSDDYPGIIRKVGTVSSADGIGSNLTGQPGYLYPLNDTNFQSWFLDTGTPSLVPFGQFQPSTGWIKPLINISDVPDESGAPSPGYSAIIYTPNTNGTFNAVSYDNAYYDIDYFAGIFRFDSTRRPIDSPGMNGLGYQMSESAFQSAAAAGTVSAINFIKGVNGGIRAIAYQYVGQRLDTFSKGATGSIGATGAPGPTGSAGSAGTSGLSGDRYRTTSTNPLTISSANTALSFTVSTSLSYTQNQIVVISYDAGNYMYGTVSSYNSSTGDISVVVTDNNGSGSYSPWTVNLFGAAGGDGSSGTSGTSGEAGSSGTSGQAGSSGTSGQAGSSGTSGQAGSSGTSGQAGSSGTSGEAGSSGTSGEAGSSGTSGEAGSSGTSGEAGSSGTSGEAGSSGTSGTSGETGSSGTSGETGSSGTSGTSGLSGDRYRTTTTDPIAISGTNTVLSFTVSNSLSYTQNQIVIISYDGSNYMYGTVSSYNSSTGDISVVVSDTAGSGNYSSWTVNLFGAAGGDGSSGTSGASYLPNGTVNFVPYYNTATTLSSTSSIQVLDNTVGIGFSFSNTGGPLTDYRMHVHYGSTYGVLISGGGASLDSIPLRLWDTGTAPANINILEFGHATASPIRQYVPGARIKSTNPASGAVSGAHLILETASESSPTMSTWNSNQLYLKNDGNVGIGNSAASARLHVVPTSTGMAIMASGSTTGDLVRLSQTGTGNVLVVEDSENPDSSPFVIQADGKVAIGTSSTVANLEVRGYGANGILLGSDLFAPNLSSRLFFSNGIAGQHTAILNSLGNIDFRTDGTNNIATGTNRMVIERTTGNVGIAQYNPLARLHVESSLTGIGILAIGTSSEPMVRITQEGTGAALVVEDSSNPDSSPFVIQADGKVAIGTSSTTHRLRVYNEFGSGDADILLVERGNSLNAAIQYKNTIGSFWTGVNTTGNFGIGTSSSVSDSSTTPFVIARNTGNIGIGTMSPGAKLHVVSATFGAVRIQDGTQQPGYVLTSDATGLATWQPAAGGASLTVEDYLTGATFSNISNICFRGNTVVVTPAGLTATGVLVTDDSPVNAGHIMVWIPAPNYVGYFSPSIGSGDQNRYAMAPTTNTISGSSLGEYSIGAWNAGDLFNAGTVKSVKMTNSTLAAFTTGTSFFSCMTNATTLTFTLYAGDGTQIRQVTGTINANTTYNSSPSGLSFTITDFAADNDRYKAKASGTIDVASLFPYGGRFYWNITHNNAGAPGTPYSFTSNDVFYDVEFAADGSSNATIGGSSFDEKTPTLVYYSGVAYYDTGSTFGFTVSGIDNLNDISIPTTKQIDITATNMAITTVLDGYADGSKPAVSSFGITGWTYSWNRSGLTFSRTGTVNQAGKYIPDFADLSSTSVNNLLNNSVLSYITSKAYDSGVAYTHVSGTKKMLFDTDTTDSMTHLNNPLDSENGRLSMTGLSNATGKGVHPSSSIVLGTATFSSTISLNTATDELQYIFGRVIYPQTNFTEYFPLTNIGASVNYVTVASASRTFNIYTAAGLATSQAGSGGGAYTATTFNSYRWHVTSFTKDAGGTEQIFNGVVKFTSNFAETDIEQGYDGNAYISNPNPYLVVLIGVDSTGNNAAPDRFVYVTGDSSVWGARISQPTSNFNGGATTKEIAWWLDQWGNSITVTRVWLFVGYTALYARGKQLWMSEITMSF